MSRGFREVKALRSAQEGGRIVSPVSSDATENGTSAFPVCSAVPEAAAPPRATNNLCSSVGFVLVLYRRVGRNCDYQRA